MGKQLGRRGCNTINLVVLLVTFTVLICNILVLSRITAVLETIEHQPAKVIYREVIKEVPKPVASRGEDARELVYFEMSLLTPSQVTPQGLQNALQGNLCGLADTFLEAEQKTGVNALFLASTSALESAWGTSNIANENNNLFGWTDSQDPSGYKQFNSKEECILYVAERLKTNYLNEDGRYFNGYTLRGINIKYSTSDQWSAKVFAIMNNLEDKLV